MSKHTPGPWTAEFAESGGYDCMTDAWFVKSSGHIICDVDLSAYGQSARFKFANVDRERAEADARLMAAAPDLLAALKDCCAALGGVKANPDAIPASAIAAIAKAKGEEKDRSLKP